MILELSCKRKEDVGQMSKRKDSNWQKQLQMAPRGKVNSERPSRGLQAVRYSYGDRMQWRKRLETG